MTQQRKFAVALDFSPGSKYALEWTTKNLLRDGDHLLLVLVHPKNDLQGDHLQLLNEHGSPLIPYIEFREPRLLQDYGVKPDIDVFDLLDTVNRQKELVITAKVYWGDARDKICDAAIEFTLDCMVVGSRGLGLLKRVLMGSVSSYVVTHAACPVTVVRMPKKTVA